MRLKKVLLDPLKLDLSQKMILQKNSKTPSENYQLIQALIWTKARTMILKKNQNQNRDRGLPGRSLHLDLIVHPVLIVLDPPAKVDLARAVVKAHQANLNLNHLLINIDQVIDPTIIGIFI